VWAARIGRRTQYVDFLLLAIPLLPTRTKSANIPAEFTFQHILDGGIGHVFQVTTQPVAEAADLTRQVLQRSLGALLGNGEFLDTLLSALLGNGQFLDALLGALLGNGQFLDALLGASLRLGQRAHDPLLSSLKSFARTNSSYASEITPARTVDCLWLKTSFNCFSIVV
jgi:hypothetical protein